MVELPMASGAGRTDRVPDGETVGVAAKRAGFETSDTC